eukprot:TRINITY_DN10085_c0_g1_i1.p1 TRINITY_DN10085_c0_g1~~TRINITY_DN10085_c0_g1_i1.p1  ORF type:complete len:331 (+),score=63.99 TRINITY_DN10085_c0_g1_i1:64-1056(+)
MCIRDRFTAIRDTKMIGEIVLLTFVVLFFSCMQSVFILIIMEGYEISRLSLKYGWADMSPKDIILQLRQIEDENIQDSVNASLKKIASNDEMRKILEENDTKNSASSPKGGPGQSPQKKVQRQFTLQLSKETEISDVRRMESASELDDHVYAVSETGRRHRDSNLSQVSDYSIPNSYAMRSEGEAFARTNTESGRRFAWVEEGEPVSDVGDGIPASALTATDNTFRPGAQSIKEKNPSVRRMRFSLDCIKFLLEEMSRTIKEAQKSPILKEEEKLALQREYEAKLDHITKKIKYYLNQHTETQVDQQMSKVQTKSYYNNTKAQMLFRIQH